MKNVIVIFIFITLVIISVGIVFYVNKSKDDSKINDTLTNIQEDKERDEVERIDVSFDNMMCKEFQKTIGRDLDPVMIDDIILYKDKVREETQIELSIKDLCGLMLFEYYVLNLPVEKRLEMDGTNFTMYVDDFSKKYGVDLETKISILDITDSRFKIQEKSVMDTSVSAALDSTLVAAKFCMEKKNGYINEQVVSQEICKGEPGEWADFSQEGILWGGCDLEVTRDDSGYITQFEYCATLSDKTVVHCTERGCK